VAPALLQQHFAEDEPFVSASNKPAGPRLAFVARRAKSYAISVDPRGTLRWSDGDLDGDHLICVVSEQVPEDYLAMLREKGISYIASGKSSVDLAHAVSLLVVPGIDGRHDIPAVFDEVSPLPWQGPTTPVERSKGENQNCAD
jgi:2,5-diamino-6-(ribosylamino)-4(3H)-pyrimidinone 5'-phosphate reductase